MTHLEQVDISIRDTNNELPPCFKDGYYQSKTWDNSRPVWVIYGLDENKSIISTMLCDDVIENNAIITAKSVAFIKCQPNSKVKVNQLVRSKFKKFHDNMFCQSPILRVRK